MPAAIDWRRRSARFHALGTYVPRRMSLADFQPEREFLVGIDSDGCVFDTMELKHKECFIPAFINHYGLQGVSKYAREAAEFVNLYSKSRGVNRFPGLVEQLDWLRRRPEVKARGVDVPNPEGLRRWIAARTEARQSRARSGGRGDGRPRSAAGARVVARRSTQRSPRWSAACRRFPTCASAWSGSPSTADLLVVSATPSEALDAEWAGARPGAARARDLRPGARHEEGNAGRRRRSTRAGNALMIGDAPGDYKAAAANKCLFFPINPGHEEASWQRLFEEGSTASSTGTFAGEYQTTLLDEFDRLSAGTCRRGRWR